MLYAWGRYMFEVRVCECPRHGLRGQRSKSWKERLCEALPGFVRVNRISRWKNLKHLPSLSMSHGPWAHSHSVPQKATALRTRRHCATTRPDLSRNWNMLYHVVIQSWGMLKYVKICCPMSPPNLTNDKIKCHKIINDICSVVSCIIFRCLSKYETYRAKGYDASSQH